MKYCSQCGSELKVRIPPDDNRERFICDACDIIHYQNPKIVAGCIPEYKDKILLCKRAIEPRHGFWTLPAGFMELGETSLEAAIRETYEEAKAEVEILDLYTMFNLPYVNQVYLMFRARLARPEFSPGEESLEVKLCTEDEIPWQHLAFRTIHHTLKYYFTDRVKGEFRLHTGDIIRKNQGYHFIEGPSENDIKIPDTGQ